MDAQTRGDRLLEALENIAAELERLRFLKEHELSAKVMEDQGDMWVRPSSGTR